MNVRAVAVWVSLATLPASTAYAHSPDCYRNVGLGTLVLFVVALLSGVFWMERTFGTRAKGMGPVIAWVGFVGLGLLASLAVGAVGVIALCG